MSRRSVKGAERARRACRPGTLTWRSSRRPPSARSRACRPSARPPRWRPRRRPSATAPTRVRCRRHAAAGVRRRLRPSPERTPGGGSPAWARAPLPQHAAGGAAPERAASSPCPAEASRRARRCGCAGRRARPVAGMHGPGRGRQGRSAALHAAIVALSDQRRLAVAPGAPRQRRACARARMELAGRATAQGPAAPAAWPTRVRSPQPPAPLTAAGAQGGPG